MFDFSQLIPLHTFTERIQLEELLERQSNKNALYMCYYILIYNLLYIYIISLIRAK